MRRFKLHVNTFYGEACMGAYAQPGEIKIMQLTELQTNLLEALRALTDWGRDNTSPRDTNTPHDLLVNAANVIAEADKLKAESPNNTVESIAATVRRETLAGTVTVKTAIGNLTPDEASLYSIRVGQSGVRNIRVQKVTKGGGIYSVHVTEEKWSPADAPAW